jgi:hypothetical protein
MQKSGKHTGEIALAMKSQLSEIRPKDITKGTSMG